MTAESVTDNDLAQLREAADGLTDGAVARVLSSVGLSRRLESVPRSKVMLVVGALRLTRRDDARPPVAEHLGPLGADGELERLAAAMSEARNHGYEAFEAARDAYNQALNRHAGVGVALQGGED